MNIIELRDHAMILVKAKKNKSFIDVQESKIIEFEDGFKNSFVSPEISTKLSQEIRQFFSHDRDCLLCLGITNVIYRDIITPKTNEKYLKSLVKHELTNALNLTSDYLIDYANVGEMLTENVKQNKLLVAAIQTNNLNEILQFFIRCGLNIKKIDVTNNALVNFVRQNKLLNLTENSIIVDISNKQIRQFLFENGQFSYHRVTRANLNVEDETNNYRLVLDAIEKMIQFSVAQGRIKKLDTILFIGFPFLNNYLELFKNDLNLKIEQIDLSKSIHFKQEENAQLIYAVSLLYKLEKKKNIDLMVLYNSLNKKNDWVEKINPLFTPTLAIMTYIILTTLIILVIKTINTNKSIEEINAYLSQDQVMSKMFEITESTARTNKMNEILVEVDSIQLVLSQIPRLNQEIILKMYAVKPEEISIQSISYAGNSIEIAIESTNSSLIYQYIIALKDASFFKEVEYNTYARSEKELLFKSSVTLTLKEVD